MHIFVVEPPGDKLIDRPAGLDLAHGRDLLKLTHKLMLLSAGAPAAVAITIKIVVLPRTLADIYKMVAGRERSFSGPGLQIVREIRPGTQIDPA